MQIKDRIKIYIKHLGISVREFEKRIGKSNGYVNNIVNTITADVIVSISKEFIDLDTTWLLTGEGEMIKGTSSNVIEADPNYMDVELVSKYAHAGYLCGYGDQEYIQALPKIKVPTDHDAKGNYKAFEVKGDSMCDNSVDSYLDGDIILCREVYQHLWLPKLRINTDDFVIIHKEGILLKRIIKQDNDLGIITIHSLNTDKSVYPDEDLLLNDCLQIFNVIKIVDRKKRR